MTFPANLQNGLIPAKLVSPSLNTDLSIKSGKKVTARLIDVTTKDYVVNNEGGFTGMDPVDQAVQLAVFTTFGTAITPIGSTLMNIRLITPALKSLVQNAVKKCLQNLIDDKQIILGNVRINNVGSSRVSLYIPFKNLISGQNKDVTMKLGQ